MTGGRLKRCPAGLWNVVRLNLLVRRGRCHGQGGDPEADRQRGELPRSEQVAQLGRVQRGAPLPALRVGQVEPRSGLLTFAVGERPRVDAGEPDLVDQADHGALRAGTLAVRFAGGGTS